MRTFGWSKIQLRDGKVFMGPAREDTLGRKPFCYIEAIGTDGLLYPAWCNFDDIVSIQPVEEKFARERFAMQGASILQIKEFVSFEFNVSLSALESAERSDELVRPRWVAFVVARELGFKFTYIAKAFNRDHVTVIYGVEEAYKRATIDHQFKFHLEEARKKFGLSRITETAITN